MTVLKRKRISNLKRSPLRKSSAKGAKAKREYKVVCDHIDEKMMDEHGYIFCTSCEVRNTGYNGMAHSHNMPKGMYPEFETKEWNISPRCLDCHRALDDHNFEDIQYFKDLDDIMIQRAHYNVSAYNKFVTGLQEVGCINYDYIKIY